MRQLSLKIGEDIAMVSFDDLEVLQYFMLSITAIAQPLEEIADKIMEILMYRLTDNTNKDKIKAVLGTSLKFAIHRKLNCHWRRLSLSQHNR